MHYFRAMIGLRGQYTLWNDALLFSNSNQVPKPICQSVKPPCQQASSSSKTKAIPPRRW